MCVPAPAGVVEVRVLVRVCFLSSFMTRDALGACHLAAVFGFLEEAISIIGALDAVVGELVLLVSRLGDVLRDGP